MLGEMKRIPKYDFMGTTNLAMIKIDPKKVSAKKSFNKRIIRECLCLTVLLNARVDRSGVSKRNEKKFGRRAFCTKSQLMIFIPKRQRTKLIAKKTW
jgi:hypothetical protein